MSNLIPPSDQFQWPTIPYAEGVQPEAKLKALLGELSGWHYGLGSKIIPVQAQQPGLHGTDETGHAVMAIDCSGFTRWAVYHLTGGLVEMPDGSVNQHPWVEDMGLKPTFNDAGELEDGFLRIAFLTPEASGEDIGHVLLVLNGQTYESHGDLGPDSRHYAGLTFRNALQVYVMGLPV